MLNKSDVKLALNREPLESQPDGLCVIKTTLTTVYYNFLSAHYLLNY